jgi:hypothetical protein
VPLLLLGEGANAGSAYGSRLLRAFLARATSIVFAIAALAAVSAAHAECFELNGIEYCGPPKPKTTWRVTDPLQSCYGRGPKDFRPGGDSCIKLAETEGIEESIMKCCQRTANDKPWFPYVNDCHDSTDRCLTTFGITNPGAPGGRAGRCDSCWIKNNPPPPSIDHHAP